MEYESGLAEHERLKLFSRKKYVLQGLLMDYIKIQICSILWLGGQGFTSLKKLWGEVSVITGQCVWSRLSQHDIQEVSPPWLPINCWNYVSVVRKGFGIFNAKMTLYFLVKSSRRLEGAKEEVSASNKLIKETWNVCCVHFIQSVHEPKCSQVQQFPLFTDSSGIE